MGGGSLTDGCSGTSTGAPRSFTTSTRNLLAAEAVAGVGHHVALSVVGSDRLTESGYFRAKIAQESLITESPIPHSIVRATQFFEFIKGIADGATENQRVRVAPVLIQPMAADDVATALAQVATGAPVGGTVEVGGGRQFRLDEIVRRTLVARGDAREVVADPSARYFGARLGQRTLLPADGARLGETSFESWLARPQSAPPLANRSRVATAGDVFRCVPALWDH